MNRYHTAVALSLFLLVSANLPSRETLPGEAPVKSLAEVELQHREQGPAVESYASRNRGEQENGTLSRARRVLEAFLGAMPALIGLYHLILFFMYREVHLPLWSGIMGLFLSVAVFSRYSGELFPFFTEGSVSRSFEYLGGAVLFVSIRSWLKDRGSKRLAGWTSLFLLVFGILASFPALDILSRGDFYLLFSIIGMIGLVFALYRKQGLSDTTPAILIYTFLSMLMLFVYAVPGTILEIMPLAGFGHIYLVFFTLIIALNMDHAQKKIEQINRRLKYRIESKSKTLQKTLAAVSEREAILRLELEIASEIQDSLLPVMPIVIEETSLRLEGFSKFREGIGGDLYDVLRLQSGTTAVLSADVSGHGIPAALVAVMARIVFRDAIRKSTSPINIFYNANRILVEAVTSREYLSAFLVLIEPDGSCVYGNAGHPWPLVYRRKTGRIDEWQLTGGLFVGALKNSAQLYGEKRDHLHAGDRVLFFSDGIIDQIDPGTGENFGNHRLAEALRNTIHLDLGRAKEEILDIWKRYIKTSQIRDDVSFVLLEKE